MKKNCCKSSIKGFTLIELLVVVLIIGILAAIALPQYQKAVEKSRVTEALQNAKLIEECFDWYILEHGMPTSPTTNVAIQNMNCPIEINLGQQNTTENFEYLAACTAGGCGAEIDHKSYDYAFVAGISPSLEKYHFCYTNDTDKGRYVCNSIRNQGWKYIDDTL